MENKHFVAVTGIIIKNGKYLIIKRNLNKRVFPGKWTVPGGNLELVDYVNSPKDTSEHWYNLLEKVLRREVKEETGLEIKNIKYLTSMTFIRPDNIPVLVVGLYADYFSGDVSLSKDMTDYAWVSLKESKNYDLIDGIYEELEMLDKILKGEKIEEWKKPRKLKSESFGFKDFSKLSEQDFDTISSGISIPDTFKIKNFEVFGNRTPSKSLIGIDIDEVVAEFLESFLKFYNTKYNKEHRKEDFETYQFEDTIGGTHEDAVNLVKEFGNHYFFENLPLVDGAVEHVKELSKEYEIIFITARHPMFKEKTESFLKKYFEEIFSEVLYTGEAFAKYGITKADLCKERGIKIMIDDNKLFANELAEKGVKVFLLDKPWNKNYDKHENIIKVKDWKEVIKKIQEVKND